MCAPDIPAPPDPYRTAAAQTGTNVGTAVANSYLQNYNQITPDSTTTFNPTGAHSWTDPSTGSTYDIPTFTQTTTLSPGQQAIKNQTDAAKSNLAGLAQSQSGRLNDVLSSPFDISGLPAGGDASTLTKDYSADRKRVEDALMQRLSPQLQASDEALRTRLMNSGVQAGSTAYDRAVDESNRASNDARLGVIAQGGQEQSRLTGLDLQAFNAQQAQRQQSLDEAFATRNQPVDEISALLSGSQVSQPQFKAAQVNPIANTDIAGLINQNYTQQLQGAQIQNQYTQSLLGGLAGLGAGFLGNPSLKLFGR